MRSALLFLIGLAAMLAAGWTGFPKALYVSRPQPLQFNHQVHADKAGLECSGCHELRADGRFSGIPGISNSRAATRKRRARLPPRNSW